MLTLPSGKVIVESGAIGRYAGRLAGLYPTEPEKALLVDEVVELLNSIMAKAPQEKDPELKKQKRQEYAAGFLKKVLSLIASRISEGGQFILGNELSVADVALYGFLKMLYSGFLDDIPPSYPDQWPEFPRFISAMEANDKFSPYKL